MHTEHGFHPQVPLPDSRHCRQAYCVTCQREISLSPEDGQHCPVCSFPLVPIPSASAGYPDSARSESSDDLVAGLRQHEEWALRLLIKAFGDHVYGHALHILKDPRLAEGVAREALLTMWHNPERFDPAKGNLRSFLIGVARVTATARQPKAQRRPSIAPGLGFRPNYAF